MYTLNQTKTRNHIYSISNFLSDMEIKKIFDICKDREFVDAAIGSEVNVKENKNFLNDHKLINPHQGVVKRIRKTNVKWIYLDEHSNWLFKKIICCINKVNSENYNYLLKYVEDLQFSEYSSENKGFYSKHTDCGDLYDMENFVDIRKLSFSIQLSDPKDYEGGELKFYTRKKSIYTNEEEYVVAKKDKGSIIFFPSKTLHEVSPVTRGNRNSLVGWVCGPNLF